LVIDFTSCASDGNASFRPAKSVRRVDHDLAFEPRDLAERVRDRTGRNRDENDIGVRRVTAVLAQLLNLVSCPVPASREATADVPSTDRCDLHARCNAFRPPVFLA
jgi:hypothetical protein